MQRAQDHAPLWKHEKKVDDIYTEPPVEKDEIPISSDPVPGPEDEEDENESLNSAYKNLVTEWNKQLDGIE